MVTRKRKIIISATSVALLLIFAATMLIMYFTVGHSFNKYNQPTVDYSLFNKDATLTKSQVDSDRNKLIQTTEKTHPYFAIKESVDGYAEAKQKFLDADIATAADFYFAAAEYLAVFKDLHTAAISAFPDYITLGLVGYADNNKWMLYPYGEADEAYEAVAINNVHIGQIIGKYASLENDNSIVSHFARVRLNAFLEKAGIEWDDSLTFTYKRVDGTTFDVSHSILENETSGNNAAVENFEAEIIDGDILYIRARSMSDDGSFSDCIGFIKNAVNSGIKKTVIDVTGNGGGSDSFGYKILEALGFKFSDMGLTIRYSETTAKYRGTWRKSGSKTTHQFKYRSENKNNIELKVFCDEFTASAAMSVVNNCRYSDLSEILGRIPGQNTNFCGNGIIFQLSNSKVAFILPLSYSYFERNGQKAPDKLLPDIEVPALADYMNYVIWN